MTPSLNTTTATTNINQAAVATLTEQKPPKTSTVNTASQLSGHSIKAEYIQVFASSNQVQATKLATVLSKQYKQKTQLEEINGIFRVLVGPIERSDDITKQLLTIKSDGYPNAFIRQ